MVAFVITFTSILENFKKSRNFLSKSLSFALHFASSVQLWNHLTKVGIFFKYPFIIITLYLSLKDFKRFVKLVVLAHFASFSGVHFSMLLSRTSNQVILQIQVHTLNLKKKQVNRHSTFGAFEVGVDPFVFAVFATCRKCENARFSELELQDRYKAENRWILFAIHCLIISLLSRTFFLIKILILNLGRFLCVF